MTLEPGDLLIHRTFGLVRLVLTVDTVGVNPIGGEFANITFLAKSVLDDSLVIARDPHTLFSSWIITKADK